MAKGGAPEPQQGGGGDKSYDVLWVAAAIVISALLLWHFEKTYISMGILAVKLAEIKIVSGVFFAAEKISQVFGFPVSFPTTTLDNWTVFIHKNYGSAVDFPTIIMMSNEVGKYIFIPISVVMALFAAILFLGGSANKFRNTFSVGQFRSIEQKNWPYITPVIKQNLIDVPLEEGPWAAALDPMRFCKKNDLIRIETKDGKTKISLKHGAAFRVLSLQLGPRWYSIEQLPMHLQALFAVFCSRMNGDKKSGDELLGKIAASASGQKPDFTPVKELLKKHSNCKQANKIINLHGYVTTVMASLLIAAREVGVLAASEFIWLKPLDRRMWYMLNSVGRPTAFSEVSGAFAHWLAEKKLGLPLMVPTVDEAVKGLEIAMGEILYKPEED